MEIKNIETILKRLMPDPKFKGNMVQDTQSMYEETDPLCTFKWVDERPKPTFAEITAEFHIYCAEPDCPLRPENHEWDSNRKTFVKTLGSWLENVIKPERDSRMDAFQWRVARALDNQRNGRPGENLKVLDSYMQELRNFPATLTEIIEPEAVEWPPEPEDMTDV